MQRCKLTLLSTSLYIYIGIGKLSIYIGIGKLSAKPWTTDRAVSGNHYTINFIYIRLIYIYTYIYILISTIWNQHGRKCCYSYFPRYISVFKSQNFKAYHVHPTDWNGGQGSTTKEFYPFKFVPMICLSSTSSQVWTRFRPYVVTSSICFLGITVTSHKCHGISNKQRLDFLFNSLFRLTTTNKISALLVLCEGNLSVTGGFPTQRTNNVETISMWWCLHWP